MKDFAKYLPVEGEIKDGDLFLGSDGKIYQRASWQAGWQSPKARKVKLFLCSRDIAVGDKEIYVHKPDGTEITKVELVDIVTDGTTTALKVKEPSLGEFGTLIQNAFKVIGEISPEATWVKEGMEFDEDQVHVVTFYRSEYGWSIERPWTDMLERKEFYAIKCSQCGHFH